MLNSLNTLSKDNIISLPSSYDDVHIQYKIEDVGNFEFIPFFELASTI
jgi:hypothetical protein